MKVVHEFRQFIRRGNVMDMAVGIIMGAAFTKIVNSLVADIIMPPIGSLVGGVKFTELKVTLPALRVSDVGLEPATLNYGTFLQTVFDFLIIAFCVFLMIKGINELHRRLDASPEPVAAPPEATPTEKLLTEIRDLLKESRQEP